MNKRLKEMSKEEIVKQARQVQGHLMGEIAELRHDLDKATEERNKAVKERNVWRIVCCVSLAVFLILGYFGVW